MDRVRDGEHDRAHRRRRRARLAWIALAVIGAGCSSAASKSASKTVAPAIVPTTAPLAPEAAGSLGGPLPTGPAPPPTTGALGHAPSTAAARGPGVSATHDPATPDCPSVDLTATAATDRAAYPDGTPVAITVSVLNSNASVCQFHPSLIGGGVAVQTSVGNPVWSPRPPATPPPYYRMAPQQTVVVVSVSWDQRMCPPPCTGSGGARPTRGSYRALPQVSGVATVKPAPFTLT